MRARGLIWDVLDVDRNSDRECFSLRCVDGDMAGLEWDIYVPPDKVEMIDAAIDPRHPVPLASWRLMHRARVLNELPAQATFVARNPGRIQVEPYQLVPLLRALEMPRPRLLLADGVGLGKTIQALLIAVEFIARRRAHRILIVVPAGPLLRQWEQEARLRFALKFTRVTNAAELSEVRRSHELGVNLFDTVSLCITALDFAKQDHVLEELERSTWDLVIIDEAHHCAGFGNYAVRDNTYRRRLAEVLARRSDGLLLLTATPHDGHDAHFASLIGLLDPSLVDGAGGLIGHGYRRHVIRRMKVHIRDPHSGLPRFRRRQVIPVKVDALGPEHEAVREFHRALSQFVVPRLRRHGADDGLAFVSLLKRSVSTVSACLKTLHVVAERLSRFQFGEVETKAAQRERVRAMRAWRRRTTRFGSLNAADEVSQTMLETESIATTLRAQGDTELGKLIDLGVAAEAQDPKLSTIILEVRLIRIEHPRTNILIYTEYSDSQEAAVRALQNAGGVEGEILTIGGQDEELARTEAAQRFAERDGLILISTDSLAEGLNLHQHCFNLIHLDLPYNPNRLEQRNGRIDRYGQRHEPQIRYLFIPGTFEEALLLHLIKKYEGARQALDVMPDTLGVTANEDDYQASLTGSLSEDPRDLFGLPSEAIRTLDQSVVVSNPGVVSELMREIDRSFEAFELMAVAHGWRGIRGINAGLDQLPRSGRTTDPVGSDDLTDFVGLVAEAATGERALIRDEISLPSNWLHGLDGIPGLDADRGVIHVSRDLDHHGENVGFLTRAHPLVIRAIREGCHLPGAVSVARADHVALLQTFELESTASSHPIFRNIIAIMATPDRLPFEITPWLQLGSAIAAVDDVWDQHFAGWAEAAVAETTLLATRIACEQHASLAERHQRDEQREFARTRHWLGVMADRLCGPFTAKTGDLFGHPQVGPTWRQQEDPQTRLVSFATDPETSTLKRREVDDVLKIFRTITLSKGTPGPIIPRPIGMLMLVPRDVL